jgi:hypothetical protein
MIIETDVDIEAIIEEIDFSWCIGGDRLVQPEKCIPIGRVWSILSRHIPEIDNFFKTHTNDTNTKDNSSLLA